jgi:hypothetical protein
MLEIANSNIEEKDYDANWQILKIGDVEYFGIIG